ncbi:MAG: RNA polymerase sigma factor [Chloroflexi bacterium]|nr:MAG: RNA polymerase sigma factor [Chloroflexota bacterium]
MKNLPASTQNLNSANLYTDCRSNNKERQHAAYQTLWHYLYRVALNVVYDQPDSEALAQDCAQEGLIRVHKRIDECREPGAFKSWARRIVSNLAIDELRRRKRLIRPENHESFDKLNSQPIRSQNIGAIIELEALRKMLEQSPMSDRSRRVVIGRYLDALPDELLAQKESEITQSNVRPSHLQVTRAKNIKKLRKWMPIHTFFGKG